MLAGFVIDVDRDGRVETLIIRRMFVLLTEAQKSGKDTLVLVDSNDVYLKKIDFRVLGAFRWAMAVEIPN